MRLIFIGSGAFAIPALEALASSRHEIVRVCSQPPRRAGRGNRTTPTPLARRAGELGLDVHCPESVDDPEFALEMSRFGADVGVLVDHGALLPRSVLSAPLHGFLNIHPSLLPRWRGAAPIQRAIMAGDAVTGVCVIQMNERFDQGPVLLRREVPVVDNDTHSTLAPRLAAIGGEMLVEVLSQLGRLEPVPQGSEDRTRAPKVTKSETRIDWRRPAQEICRQIRGLADTPGAWTSHGKMRLKVFAAKMVDGEGPPGAVLDSHLTVACGEGAIRLLELQRPGGRPLSAGEFLRGCRILPGDALGGREVDRD